MTLRQLANEMTREEMIGWAAYFALKNEEEEKQRDSVQRGRANRVQGRQTGEMVSQKQLVADYTRLIEFKVKGTELTRATDKIFKSLNKIEISVEKTNKG